MSLVLVETDRPGFQRGRHLEKIGCKAQDTAPNCVSCGGISPDWMMSWNVLPKAP